MKPRITIIDVAKRAGVHYTTVSMALRNHPRLPVSTRERLRALADEMGYRPDPVLHALIDYRTQRTPRRGIATLAYVANGDTRWGWKQERSHADFFAGAESRASSLGYQLEHFWLNEPGLTHRRLSEVLHSRGIVGMIIASHRYEIDMSLHLDWAKFCTVKIDFFPQEPALHNVASDRSAAVRLAMRRVRDAGYRRIGFVMHRLWDVSADLAWSSSFIAEQQTIPPEDQLPLFMFGDRLPPQGTAAQPEHLAPRSAFEAWLRQFQPEALISTEAFVKPHLEAMGISVPRDLAFADILVPDSDGKVAGVRHNCRRVGEIAVEILTNRMQQHSYGVPEFATTTLVDGTWVDGESLPRRSITASVPAAQAVTSS